jgi:putative ABC transport system permease protein
MTIREFFLRLGAWLRRDQLARSLDSELEAHAELLARDLAHAGMTPDEARLAARKQLGNTTLLRESSRDAWGFPRLENVIQDLRYGARGLLHAPGFTATVIITLGLGIGANAAMFAVIDRLMFRPFPHMRDPGSVHRVYVQTTINGRRNPNSTIPFARYLDLTASARSFSEVAAVSEWRLGIGVGENTRIQKVAGVSSSFFGLFNLRGVRGRVFTAVEDQRPAGTPVAVVTHEYWQSGLGGRDVLNSQLRVGKFDYTIIGILPPGFVGTVQGRPPHIFVPITTIPANLEPWQRDVYATQYNWDWMDIIVRRKHGVSVAAANAELSEAYRRSRNVQREQNPRVLPDSIAHPQAMVAPLRNGAGPDPGPESRVLLWVSGVAGIVLLIACANVANIMLTRVLRRRREIAVRLALGVSRSRLLGQFVIEALLLALLGVAVGLVFAQWGGSAIRALVLPEGSAFNLGTDWRTIGVAGACALAAALLSTIGPAVLAARSELTSSLKSAGRGTSHRRSALQAALLVTQGALSVALLVGAGLFVRSLNRVRDISLGFDVSRVVDVYPDFRNQNLESAGEEPTLRQLLAAAKLIPGAAGAARANSALFRTSTARLRIPGIDSVEQLGRFNYQVVSPEYFDVVQTRILRGRGFTEIDAPRGPRVAVVSQAMARVLWPGREPLGQCMDVSWEASADVPYESCTTVVGVAEDAAYQGLTDEQRFVYYLNQEQMPAGWARAILVRLNTEPNAAEMERVRSALQRVMPGDGMVILRKLQDVVEDQSRSWRLGTTLFVAFGGLAVVVAAVGLYGVIGYTIAQRMHELGMRIALGARSSHILKLVLGQGVWFAGTGAAIGLALAFFASRFIEPLLYKQSARDPFIYLSVATLMIVVGLAASALPALRALRADPNRALRTD